MVHRRGRAARYPRLLAQADQALYFAKERGRNRVEIASLQQVLERAKAAGRDSQAIAAAAVSSAA